MATSSTPLEDDDLLQEILLRLPPLPSALSRASLVCARWRRILSDGRFLRRFREHHPDPPVLGFFKGSVIQHRDFIPVLDPPDRIPTGRLFVPANTGKWYFLGCRHGLAVMLSTSACQVFVWDPLHGQQHRIPFPPELRDAAEREQSTAPCLCSAALVVHDDGGDGFSIDSSPSFKLVLVLTHKDSDAALACLYESASGAWGSIASTPCADVVLMLRPSVLIGNAVYWLLHHGRDILTFDLETQALAVIEKPAAAQLVDVCSFQVIRRDHDVLGLAVMSELGIHMWERRVNSDGVAGWVDLHEIIQLEGKGIFPQSVSSLSRKAAIVGYDEESNVLVLSTVIGDFMLHLESMRFKLIFKKVYQGKFNYFPYKTFFAAGRGVGRKWVDPDLNRRDLQKVHVG